MGNMYSLIEAGTDHELNSLLKEEIKKLESNIKKIDNMLELLNFKCDKIITKVEILDNKTYELIDIVNYKTRTPHTCSEWDYYDLNPNSIDNVDVNSNVNSNTDINVDDNIDVD